MDCLDNCKHDALHYQYVYGKKEVGKPATDASRRGFFSAVGVVAATAALHAQEKQQKALRQYQKNPNKRTDTRAELPTDKNKVEQKVDGGLADIEPKLAPERLTPLTPPGSLGIGNFAQHCTACQLCVSACPNDVLRPSTKLENLMQPEMSYERGYCRPECVKCSEVCPTGAIKLITRADKSAIQIGHAMYKQSLKDLQTDYIDYYLLHSIGNGGIETFRARYIDNGMLDYLIEERKAGRIRNLGFSFHGTVDVFDEVLAMHDHVHWDFVQIQLNYVDWRHASGRNVNAEYLYAELEKRGIPAIIMEPLLGGRLSNVPEHIMMRLKERTPQSSVASWAFRFAGSLEKVLTVLSGMTYMEHLQDNIRTYSPLVPLSDEEKDFLEETAQLMLKYPTVPCNDCKYCMPCPYGIDIPAILLHYNKCVNEGNLPKSQQDENYKEARRAYLVGYDRSVPKLRQASHCIGCGQCNSHCPQSIDIPKELHRIDQFVEQLKQGTL